MLQEREQYTIWASNMITLSGKNDVASNTIVDVRQQNMLEWTYGTKKGKTLTVN